MSSFFEDVIQSEECTVEDCMMENAAIEADRACAYLDTVEAISGLNTKQAYLECMISGDDENLGAYYEKADAQTAVQKENILKTAWKKIKEFLQKIIDTIFKKKPAENVEKSGKIKVPAWIAYIVDNFKSAWSKVKGLIASGKQKLAENNNWKKFLAVLGIASAGVILSVVFTKREKKNEPKEIEVVKLISTSDALHDCAETLHKAAEKQEKMNETAEGMEAQEVNKAAHGVQIAGRTITNLLGDSKNYMTGDEQRELKDAKKHAGHLQAEAIRKQNADRESAEKFKSKHPDSKYNSGNINDQITKISKWNKDRLIKNIVKTVQAEGMDSEKVEKLKAGLEQKSKNGVLDYIKTNKIFLASAEDDTDYGNDFLESFIDESLDTSYEESADIIDMNQESFEESYDDDVAGFEDLGEILDI